MNLIFLTQSYPYISAGEQSFITQEITYLRNAFDRIYIIPKVIGGKQTNINFENLIITEDYAQSTTNINKLKALTKLPNYNWTIWKLLIKEIITTPTVLIHPKKLLTLLIYLYQINEFSTFFNNFIKKVNLNISQSLFYTYWFQQTTIGLALLKDIYPNIKVVTRAHNIDLYKERHPFNYFPFRQLMINRIDGIFPCMEAGSKYIREHYRLSRNMIFTSYLGVIDNFVINQPSTDGTFRIITCSSITTVKRLNLLAESIITLLKVRPEIKIKWTHFGDGEQKKEIYKITEEINSLNFVAIFFGQVENEEIIKYYQNESVDVFINVSSYEGQPVSIKEAVSFGIPIIATDVGGNSEIVTKDNGILLSTNPSALEIASAVEWFVNNPLNAKKMRQESRRIYIMKYDSKKVYPDFINMLNNIVKQ